MENLPPTRQLQYLVALAKTQSFTKAAELCNVTQSTFSAGISALENLLGQKLVNRDPRLITLTALGDEVYRMAQSVIFHATNIMHTARRGQGLVGPLRMGVIPTIAPYLLPQLLPRIQRDWPKLDLYLQEGLSAELLEKLNRGQLDIVLMAFPYETPGFSQKTVFSEEFVFASNTPSHMTMAQDKLRNYDLLLLEDGHCLRTHAIEACHLQTNIIQKAFSTTCLPTLIEMVRHGYGATLLPEMAANQNALGPGIYLRRFDKPAPTRDIGLTWRDGHLGHEDIENLSATIKSCAPSLEYAR